MASGVARLPAAWAKLRAEQRLAAYASLALFVTMFLPWYSKTVVNKSLDHTDISLTAWGAFSFVEAAVLLVAAGVLVLLFFRGEGRAFHLPFGDGAVIMAGGIWVCLLVFYRQFDKPAANGAISVGVSWGIFLTLLAGAFLAYAGNRLRAAHVAEPALPRRVRPTTGPAPDVPMQADPAPPPGPIQHADPRPRPARDQAQTVVNPREPERSPLPWEDDDQPKRSPS